MGSNSVTRKTRSVVIVRSTTPSEFKNSLYVWPGIVAYEDGKSLTANSMPIPRNGIAKIPFNLTDVVIQKIKNEFTDIADAPYEIATIINEKGKNIPIEYESANDSKIKTNYISSEEPYQVHFHKNAINKMKNNILIHNHPGGFSSFSPADLTITQFQPKELQIRHPTNAISRLREINSDEFPYKRINLTLPNMLPYGQYPSKDLSSDKKTIDAKQIMSELLDSTNTVLSTLPRSPRNNAYIVYPKKIGERIYPNKDGWNQLNKHIKTVNEYYKKKFKKNDGFSNQSNDLIDSLTLILKYNNPSVSPEAIHYLSTLSYNKFMAKKFGYNHEIFEVK